MLKSPQSQVEFHPHLASSALDIVDIIHEQEKRNFRLGVLFIVIAVATWMTGLELVNFVFKGGEYDKPYLCAMLAGSSFALNLLPEVYHGIKYLVFYTPSSPDMVPRENTPLLESPDSKDLPDRLDEPQELTSSEIFVLALQLAIVYYTYNICSVSALKYTSASNATVLSSTTTIHTLILGTLLSIDHFTVKKVFCIFVSLLGVVLINLGQSSHDGSGGSLEPKNPLLGNILACSAAFLYSIYLLLMKVRCGTGNRYTNERILFGYMGLLTFAIGVPVISAMHFFGIEKFEFPPSTKILVFVLVNAVFSYISDFVTILAMLLTSPLITSLSLTSSIPISIFLDYVIIHATGGESTFSNFVVYVFGVVSILTSVVLININLSNENDYIEEIIEDALEGAIRHDEVLSPYLSPLVEAHSTSTPRLLRSLDLKASFSPKSNRPATVARQVSRFNLNLSGSREDAPVVNENHGQLYSIDQGTEDEPELVVYGGVNHNYYVVTSPKPTTPN